jgi:hypothetical protein
LLAWDNRASKILGGIINGRSRFDHDWQIGRLPGNQFNTRSNPFCLAMNQNAADNVICRSCYSHEMLKAYRANTVPALQRNSDALSQAWDPGKPVRLTGRGRKTFQPGEYVRISGHGEIVNSAYVANVMRISREPTSAVFLVD